MRLKRSSRSAKNVAESEEQSNPEEPSPAAQGGSLLQRFRNQNIDTSRVEVDDEDQLPPKVQAGSQEELKLLREMDALLPDPAKSAPTEFKLMSLRGRKYDPVRAAKLFPDFLDLMQEFDVEHMSPELARDLKTCKIRILGTKDSRGRLLINIRLRLHNPKECPAKQMARLISFVLFRALKDVDVQRHGVCILQDFTGIGLKNLDPSVFKYVTGSVLPRIPIRVYRVVIFNPPFIFGKIVLPIIFSFLSSKLKSRLKVVNSDNVTKIHSIYPPEMLSQHYQGTVAFDEEEWVDGILSQYS